MKGCSMRHVRNVYIITDISVNYEDCESCLPVLSGNVPRIIHGSVLHIPCMFETNTSSMFNDICKDHMFHDLHIATKTGQAFRKGVYITPVEKTDVGYKYNVLRCSTDLSGPTQGTGPKDNYIIGKCQWIVSHFFAHPVKLNHVLAQTYHNHIIDGRHTKARISKHSDKTKDMPESGVIVFCTFYDNDECVDDNMYQKLRFELKSDVISDRYLPRVFDICLRPNSVYIISLETNRLYTHKICPSELDVAQIPTRMGYVIRCSNTSAIYMNGETYIHNCIKLDRTPDPSDIAVLKQLYIEENKLSTRVEYGMFNFSLNSGDYMEPVPYGEIKSLSLIE